MGYIPIDTVKINQPAIPCVDKGMEGLEFTETNGCYFK